MDFLFGTPILPIVIGLAFLGFVAFHEYRTYRVPNAWILGALAGAFVFSIAAPFFNADAAGNLISSLFGALAAGGLLLPAYIKGQLGAGCVKAQAVFGAWLGAGVGVAECFSIVLTATTVAAVAAYGTWYFNNMKSKDKSEPTVIDGQLPLSVGTALGFLAMVLM